MIQVICGFVLQNMNQTHVNHGSSEITSFDACWLYWKVASLFICPKPALSRGICMYSGQFRNGKNFIHLHDFPIISILPGFKRLGWRMFSPFLRGSLWTKGHRNQSQQVDQDLLVESTMHGMVERQATWRVILLVQTFSPWNFKTFDSNGRHISDICDQEVFFHVLFFLVALKNLPCLPLEYLSTSIFQALCA